MGKQAKIIDQSTEDNNIVAKKGRKKSITTNENDEKQLENDKKQVENDKKQVESKPKKPTKKIKDESNDETPKKSNDETPKKSNDDKSLKKIIDEKPAKKTTDKVKSKVKLDKEESELVVETKEPDSDLSKDKISAISNPEFIELKNKWYKLSKKIEDLNNERDILEIEKNNFVSEMCKILDKYQPKVENLIELKSNNITKGSISSKLLENDSDDSESSDSDDDIPIKKKLPVKKSVVVDDDDSSSDSDSD